MRDKCNLIIPITKLKKRLKNRDKSNLTYKINLSNYYALNKRKYNRIWKYGFVDDQLY